jgi:hypothetical protein
VSAESISRALSELDRARKNVRAISNRQVRSPDDRDGLRATALTWFHSHRPTLLEDADTDLLSRVDGAYTTILNGADRSTGKTKYLDAMSEAKDSLIRLRAHLVTMTVKAEAAPDFSPLTDSTMRAILERRWIECTKCVRVKAHLAGIVMMGGLLEALFVARQKQMPDKAPLLAAASAPKRGAVQVPIHEWMLKSYLDVGRDLGWITTAAHDLAIVLGEFRNYVHPEKEHKHGVNLQQEDSAILWSVTKNVVAQLLDSVGK